MTNQNQKFAPLAILEPLRGFAAIWVFLSHVLRDHHPLSIVFPNFYWFVSYGYLGVPIFFVISGYCITASASRTIKKKGSVKQFIFRRLRRIYPTFWFSILVALVCISLPSISNYLGSGQSEHSRLEFIDFSLFEWIKIITLTEVFNWSVLSIATPNLVAIAPVYWTLGIEVQFYLATALLIYSGSKFKEAMTLLTIFSLLFFYPHWLACSGIFLPFWPMFAIGFFLFFIHFDSRFLPNRMSWYTWLSIAVILFAFGSYLMVLPRPFKIFAWKLSIGFSIIFATSLWLWIGFQSHFDLLKFTRSRKWKIVSTIPFYLGTISYSIYLLHLPVYRCIHQLIHPVFNTVIPYQVALIDGGLFTLTILTSALFHHFCERPFMNSAIVNSNTTNQNETTQ